MGRAEVLTLVVTLAVIVVATAPGSDGRPSSAHLTPSLSPGAPGAPFVTAAAINDSALTVSWSVPNGTVSNYSLSYAHFYGVPVATVSVGTAPVYNLTDLGYGLTYYVTVWAWNLTTRGNASNVAAVQTDPPPQPIPPFPTTELFTIEFLSILGTTAACFAISVWVSGRRSRRAEGAAAVALSRSRPAGSTETRGRLPVGRPRDSRSYSTVARRP
ncbi:MAG TPA: fibronectin type III domain-containing protein [Thermoplasmata archaeon]